MQIEILKSKVHRALVLGHGALPLQIDRALRGQSAGEHLQIFAPTMAAFGGTPPGSANPPYADLIFDIRLLGKK